MSVFCSFQLPEAACQRLLQCLRRGKAGRQAEQLGLRNPSSITGCQEARARQEIKPPEGNAHALQPQSVLLSPQVAP